MFKSSISRRKLLDVDLAKTNFGCCPEGSQTKAGNNHPIPSHARCPEVRHLANGQTEIPGGKSENMKETSRGRSFYCIYRPRQNRTSYPVIHSLHTRNLEVEGLRGSHQLASSRPNLLAPGQVSVGQPGNAGAQPVLLRGSYGVSFCSGPPTNGGGSIWFPEEKKKVPLKNKEDTLKLVSGQITTEKSEAGIRGVTS